MARKVYVAGILGIALVFIVVLAGCPDANTETPDTWTEVSTMNVLAGTWSGKGTIPIPAQDRPMGDDEDALPLPLPQSSVGMEMTVSYVADSPTMNVSTKIDMSVYLDAMVATLNKDDDMKALMAFFVVMSVAMNDELSEAEKSKALGDLGLTLTDMAALMGEDEAAKAAVLKKISINKDLLWNMMTMEEEPTPEKYFFTREETIPKEELLDENQKIYINQDSTKVKLAIPKAEFDDMEIDIGNAAEFILNKQ
jgi:hypothetical protein